MLLVRVMVADSERYPPLESPCMVKSEQLMFVNAHLMFAFKTRLPRG